MKYAINNEMQYEYAFFFFSNFRNDARKFIKKDISFISSPALHGFQKELFSQDSTQRLHLNRIIKRSRSVYLFVHSFIMALHVFYVL